MTFEALLKAHDDAKAQAEARKAAVEAARKALADAEAEAAVAQAAEAVAVAREAVHVRLKETGHHFLKGKDGRITLYRSLPDHDFEAFQPTPGD